MVVVRKLADLDQLDAKARPVTRRSDANSCSDPQAEEIYGNVFVSYQALLSIGRRHPTTLLLSGDDNPCGVL